MKRVLLSGAVFFCLLIQSCTKQTQDNFTTPAQSAKIINATILPGQTYVFNAGVSGTINISRQASHYQISEAKVDSKNGTLLYTYIPAAGYTGTDEVALIHTLTTTENNTGTCQGTHSSTTTSISNNVIIIKMLVTY